MCHHKEHLSSSPEQAKQIVSGHMKPRLGALVLSIKKKKKNIYIYIYIYRYMPHRRTDGQGNFQEMVPGQMGSEQ